MSSHYLLIMVSITHAQLQHVARNHYNMDTTKTVTIVLHVSATMFYSSNRVGEWGGSGRVGEGSGGWA